MTLGISLTNGSKMRLLRNRAGIHADEGDVGLKNR